MSDDEGIRYFRTCGCGLDHPDDVIRQVGGCPRGGRPPVKRPQRLTEQEQRELADKERQLARDIAARDRQAEAEKRERAWAKTSAVLRQMIEERRQAEQEAREAQNAALHTALEETLSGLKYMQGRAVRALVARLEAKLGLGERGPS